MLIDTLNECIIDMKTVHEMETASADTKKQAMADYNFKQLILNLKQMIDEVNLAVENSEFKPSANVINTLKSFLSLEGVRPCTRYQEIEVDYLDQNFKKQHGKYSGWTAQIIQHEIDHCNGIVI